eukprot:TRINITY_DN3849_c1_g1_i1.p1 TRINITY_DN3849_c1_g1~~TRINITY_DN3849_c1_g1_i1.p1  ORF type:complete len:294 (+),score=81.79 TRINITY_DN3849_c1_g1_i1:47-928(+)
MISDFTEWGISEVITVVVTIVFLYVMSKDFMGGKGKKPVKKPVSVQEQKPEEKTTPKEENKPAEQKEQSEESKEVKSETPKEEEKKDELDDLLDEAFDRMDTEENIVDQAWDNVHYGREVSIKVNVLDQIKESHMKAVREAKEREAAAASEKTAEERRIEQAINIRKEGNLCFNKKNYKAAIQHYSRAVRLFPPGHIELYLVYANRSVANREDGNIKEALKDAESCIKINPAAAKGHLHKAAALEGDSDWGTAKSIYQHILSKFTSSDDLQARSAANIGISRCDEKLDELLDY